MAGGLERARGAWGGVARARARQGGRAPRFWCGAGDLPGEGGGRAEDAGGGGGDARDLWLEPGEAGHAKTLRLRPGAEVELCDGRGGVQPAEILEARRGRTLVRASGPVMRMPWRGPRFRVAAALGSLQGGRAEFLVEKAAELGAAAVVPLLTARSDTVRAGRVERLRRVALSASKQSLRAHHLEVTEPVSVAEMAGVIQGEAAEVGAGAPAGGLALLAAQGAPPLASYSGALRSAAAPTFLLVGPEGDFTDEEVEHFAEAGALPVGLGDLRLRVETAAIALLGGSQAQCEEGVGADNNM